MLRLDRLRALTGVYPGVEREDEMVAAFDYCLHGKGGAAPSIDTAMHGLVDAPHVDHLHPDSGIALATAADGEALTGECFGDRVRWVPWRRPGFQLGLDIAAVTRAHPEAIGVILGGHGITAWGATSDECEANSLEIIADRAAVPGRPGAAEPFGPVDPGYEPLPEAERRARAAALAPVIRGLAIDRPAAGRALHRQPGRAGLPGPGRAAPALAALGTSCPDHFLRTKVRPMVLDLPPSAPLDEVVARLRELHAAYRRGLPGLLRPARRRRTRRRCAAPTRRSCWCPGVGMFSFGADKQTARVAGEFYLNAINVMRGAEAVSDVRPIAESGEVPHRVLGAGGGQAAPAARSPSRWPPGSRWSPGAGPASAGPPRERLAAEGACVVVADRDGAAAAKVAEAIGAGRTPAVAVTADVTDEDERGRGVPAGGAGLRRGGPGGQQRRAVDLQAAAGDHRWPTGTCSTT